MKAKLSNFVALDLGSSKIAGIAAYIDKKGDTRILTQTLHYSEGIRSGAITDLNAAENSIAGAIYSLEKECGKNIKQLAISLSGAGTKSYYVSHKMKLTGAPISKNDVTRLIEKAIAEFKIKDQDVIHYFPLEFAIDDNDAIENPVGMIGKELSCQLHIITASAGLMINLTNCLAKCQIEVMSVSLAVYASGVACLSDDEKNSGSIIIDIGARTTSFGIFFAGKLIYTGYVPLGGAHITSDIAKVFSISIGGAEKLKVLYGNAIPFSSNNDKIISLEDIDPDNPYSSVTAVTFNQLAEVINSRVEEIFLLIKEQYDKIVVDHLIARRMVITGGSSMLRGIKELAAKIFQKQVRIGKPGVIDGFAEDHNPSMYSAVVGVVRNYAIKQQKNSFELTHINGDNNWVKKVFTWLKENI